MLFLWKKNASKIDNLLYLNKISLYLHNIIANDIVRNLGYPGLGGKMYKLEKYLQEAFGIKTRLLPLAKSEEARLPVYMRNYKLMTCKIHDKNILTVNLDEDIDLSIKQLEKQADLIKRLLDTYTVFVFENIEAYKRKRLVQKNVAFIVPGRQVYIPFLFIDFKEAKTQNVKKKKNIEPAAQCILIYYLLNKAVGDMNFKTLAEKLAYGQMTISRAAQTLKKHQLCTIEGGKNKTLRFALDKKQIWDMALPYLTTPVQKEIYLDETGKNEKLFVAGINALANYTNINGDDKPEYAVYNKKLKGTINRKNKSITNAEIADYTIQVWKYDPGNLTENKIVDPLSLYLSFIDSEDERIRKELKNLINELW